MKLWIRLRKQDIISVVVGVGRYSNYCVGYYATLRLISNMDMGLNIDPLMRSG